MNTTLKKLIYTSLMLALVFVATVVIAIPMPLGYVNLGDGAIYIAAALLGPKFGFLAAALGSALGDYYLGYLIYMLPTFLVKGAMGYVSGLMFEKSKYIQGVIAGFIILVSGYYIAEVIIYSNFISPLSSIPFNGVQGAVGAVVGYLFATKFKKIFSGKINI